MAQPLSPRLLALVCACPLAMTGPAVADPAIGLGLTFSFGGGRPDVGLGIRLFSDNRLDRVVGSVGLDYLLRSRSWRGTLGASYLGRDNFVGLISATAFRRASMTSGSALV